MHIELLWIIPIVAFGSFLFLVAFMVQRHSGGSSDLSKEVARYNNGPASEAGGRKQPDGRLDEIEDAISVMSHSLGSQQKMIDKFQKENTSYTTEINVLKKKLRDLHKEYDIVLSENYSLRAKVKKLTSDTEKNPNADSSLLSSIRNGGKVNMKLYEDTRLLSSSNLDDTSEIDIRESV